MTAEIAVLNKFGVAIASDSAITVTSYHENRVKTKVHNSANKLFTLSKYAPVGIMFYNTVTLGGVPWETIVKAYRDNLNKNRFDTLHEYANDFFSFLKDNKFLFPDDTIRNIVFQNFARTLISITSNTKSKSDL